MCVTARPHISAWYTHLASTEKLIEYRKKKKHPRERRKKNEMKLEINWKSWNLLFYDFNLISLHCQFSDCVRFFFFLAAVFLFWQNLLLFCRWFFAWFFFSYLWTETNYFLKFITNNGFTIRYWMSGEKISQKMIQNQKLVKISKANIKFKFFLQKPPSIHPFQIPKVTKKS